MEKTPIDYQSPSVWSFKQDLPMWSKLDDEKGEGITQNYTARADDIRTAGTTVTKMTIITVMVTTLRTIMNSSYYYEYQENIHLGFKLTPT